MIGPTGEDDVALETVEDRQETEWKDDCMRYRGAVLTGHYAHYCDEWDGLPIDETCIEWPCCSFEPEGTTDEQRTKAREVNAVVHEHEHAEPAE